MVRNRKIFYTILIFPVMAFSLLWVIHIFLTDYMYVDKSNIFIWGILSMIEKWISLFLSGVVAFGVAMFNKDITVKLRLLFAVFSALFFQFFLIFRWILIWGIQSYLRYNSFLFTLIISGFLGVLGFYLAEILSQRRR